MRHNRHTHTLLSNMSELHHIAADSPTTPIPPVLMQRHLLTDFTLMKRHCGLHVASPLSNAINISDERSAIALSAY